MVGDGVCARRIGRVRGGEGDPASRTRVVGGRLRVGARAGSGCDLGRVTGGVGKGVASCV